MSLCLKHLKKSSLTFASAACFVTAIFIATPVKAEEASLDQWLAELKSEAIAKGISEPIFEEAMQGFKPIERVVELDRKQPEFTLTFQQYLSRVVPANRVKKAAKLLKENRAQLLDVSKKYGVQPRFIVALWGIETDFGRLTGGFSVVKALATLAHDGRRSAYFRKELLNALTILNRGAYFGERDEGVLGRCDGAMSVYAVFFLEFRCRSRWGRAAQYLDIQTRRIRICRQLSFEIRWKGDQTWGRKGRFAQRV